MSQFKKYKRMIHQLLDSKQGCEWVKSKTMQDIAAYSLEEIYELMDALDSRDYQAIQGELADLFFHVLLYAEMAERAGEFSFNDVIKTAIQKQEDRRLPFKAGRSAREVHQHWREKKYQQRLAEEPDRGLLDDIPKNMPALIRSYKIQDRAEQVGFDWDHVEQIIEKLKEEVSEFELEVDAENPKGIMDELGDILFTTVNIARHVGVDPEQALRFSNDKFTRRFHWMEQSSKRLNQPLNKMTFEEMLALWEKSKLMTEQAKP